MRWWLTLPQRWLKVIRERGWRGFVRYLFTFPRTLLPTKAGWIFFGFMLAILVFAYTTNNNLLFLIFSAMLAVMVLSGVLSETSLGKITVTRSFPDEIFAGREFTLGFTLTNRSRVLGAFAFSIFDRALFPQGQGPFIVHLKAQNTESLLSRSTLPKRGPFTPPPFELMTRYPFLLFEKKRRMEHEDRLLIFPAIHEVTLSLDELFGEGDGLDRSRQGENGGFSTLRELEPGEALRRVDWKKSAKSEDIFVKEFDRPESRRVAVVFRPQDAHDFEAGLECAASILVWLHRQRVPFALFASPTAEPGFSADADRLRRALTELALYQNPIDLPEPAGAHRIVEVEADGRFRIR